MKDFYPYYDLHCDTLFRAWETGAEDIYSMAGAMADVTKNRQGHCRLQLYAIFMPSADMTANCPEPYCGDETYIQKLYSIFMHTAQRHADVFCMAKNMADIEKNTGEGKLSGMLSMEDGRAVQGSFDNIKRFYDMGIRVMGLTWNHANCFGYPNSADPTAMSLGLTKFGKEAVSCMEELGMIIDVSHLSDGGFRDVSEICTRPFIASHSNCRTLNPHPRSMTDDMIRTLADKGGIMGINFFPGFLSENTERNDSTIDALAAQLRHRINVGGIECAAIGTDFDGIEGDLEISSAAQMPCFFEALERRGFTRSELEHIAFRNAERVFREVIG